MSKQTLGRLVGKSRKTSKTDPSVGLLELLGEPVQITNMPRFVARKRLVIDANGELPISSLGDKLKANFLGLVEKNVEPVALKRRKLLSRSVDSQILQALRGRGKKRASITLTHVFEFLKKADRRGWYIFYIEAKGILWAVDAVWNVDGWDLFADAVPVPDRRNVGQIVVSR